MKYLLSSFLIMLPLFSIMFIATAPHASEIDELKARLKFLEAQKEIIDKLDGMQSNIDGLRGKIDVLQKEMDDLRVQYDLKSSKATISEKSTDVAKAPESNNEKDKSTPKKYDGRKWAAKPFWCENQKQYLDGIIIDNEGNFSFILTTDNNDFGGLIKGNLKGNGFDSMNGVSRSDGKGKSFYSVTHTNFKSIQKGENWKISWRWKFSGGSCDVGTTLKVQ